MTEAPSLLSENDPEWRAKGERTWAHDLTAGIAATLGLFDPPELVDEPLLANVLRQIATRSDELGDMVFLRALADAFDNPLADRRLTLGRSRRGRPNSELKMDRALVIGPHVQRLIKRGWKKEAAIQDAMSATQLSRSAVIRACAEYKRLRPLTDSIQLAVDDIRKNRQSNKS